MIGTVVLLYLLLQMQSCLKGMKNLYRNVLSFQSPCAHVASCLCRITTSHILKDDEISIFHPNRVYDQIAPARCFKCLGFRAASSPRVLSVYLPQVWLTYKQHTFVWEEWSADICGFNNQMHLDLISFDWNASHTTSWSGLRDQI